MKLGQPVSENTTRMYWYVIYAGKLGYYILIYSMLLYYVLVYSGLLYHGLIYSRFQYIVYYAISCTSVLNTVPVLEPGYYVLCYGLNWDGYLLSYTMYQVMFVLYQLEFFPAPCSHGAYSTHTHFVFSTHIQTSHYPFSRAPSGAKSVCAEYALCLSR